MSKPQTPVDDAAEGEERERGEGSIGRDVARGEEVVSFDSAPLFECVTHWQHCDIMMTASSTALYSTRYAHAIPTSNFLA